MVMKQTQTKYYDFSDTGLDFSVASKNLFPDRLKKILATGFNVQTVSNITNLGDQVTLTFGVPHGYKSDRVLLVSSANGFNEEVYIDSVTENTIVFTSSSILGLSGLTSTKVAALGYELVYEKDNIHIYKFKALDESDLYLRLCYANQTNFTRNQISPCIGRSADLELGVITDESAHSDNKTRTFVDANNFKWEFSGSTLANYINYTYAEGFNSFGLAAIVGSKYHLLFTVNNSNSGSSGGRVNGFIPANIFQHEALNLPILIGESYGNTSSNGAAFMLSNARAYIGDIRVVFSTNPSNGGNSFFQLPEAASSFLPNSLDGFNTTTCAPLQVFEYPTLQFLGYASGMYVAKYASNNQPPSTLKTSPSITYDIDLECKFIVHSMNSSSSAANFAFVAIPMEEIKIAT